MDDFLWDTSALEISHPNPNRSPSTTSADQTERKGKKTFEVNHGIIPRSKTSHESH